MELQTMYPAKLGSPQTILAADITADATAMVVSDASVLPGAPNIAVIGSDENCEIISYSAIDSSTNTITISARGLGDSTAKAWTSGTTVARNHTSLDHNTLKGNIEALNTGKAEAVHTHDDRYYTESEMDTALDGKQDTYTQSASAWDTTPTTSSVKPVTSGGIKTYVDSHADFKVSGTVSASNYTLTDARINDEHWEVSQIYFATSSNVISGISWTTNITSHTISLSATYTGATNVVVKMHWVQ